MGVRDAGQIPVHNTLSELSQMLVNPRVERLIVFLVLQPGTALTLQLELSSFCSLGKETGWEAAFFFLFIWDKSDPQKRFLCVLLKR